MEPENVKSADDLLDYIEAHSRGIYIREKVNGEWGSFSLAELPGDLAIKNAFRFLREGTVPLRLKEDGE